ncbi:MAG TPA: Uma2 family endonuclease [Tepidisphaeraceae bacterium]|jgi:Uma2 family endonuclease
MAMLESQTLPTEWPARGVRMTEEAFVDWCQRDDVTRAEWVDGEVIMMAPISYDHDRLQWWLRSLLQFFVEERKLGAVVGPLFTARLTFPDGKVSRRDPDVMYIRTEQLAHLGRNHFEGAPDLTIEIVSPTSASRDWREKYLEYERAGVKEYWIVDPLSEQVEACFRGNSDQFTLMKEDSGRISSTVLPGLFIKPEWLWQKDLPDVRQILSEMTTK